MQMRFVGMLGKRSKIDKYVEFAADFAEVVFLFALYKCCLLITDAYVIYNTYTDKPGADVPDSEHIRGIKLN